VNPGSRGPSGSVHLDVDRQEVLNSSPYDPSKTADGAYDESFLTYYGIRWVEAGRKLFTRRLKQAGVRHGPPTRHRNKGFE